MTDFDSLAAGLRAWAEGDRIATAATELIIAHGFWLRRRDFTDTCTDSFEGITAIRWETAKKFAARKTLRASTHEVTILQLAVAIGSDDYRLAGKGHANAAAIMRAFATAMGQEAMPRA